MGKAKSKLLITILLTFLLVFTNSFINAFANDYYDDSDEYEDEDYEDEDYYEYEDEDYEDEEDEEEILDLANCEIGGIDDKVYTGNSIKQNFDVFDYTENYYIEKGYDYKISYNNNIDVGTATVVIKGTGDYTGTIEESFDIIPLKTEIEEVKQSDKSIKVKWKKISQKMSKSRITGYKIEVATNGDFTKNNKTYTIKGYSNTSKTISGLKNNKEYYIRICTYKTVKGKKYYSKWSSTKKATPGFSPKKTYIKKMAGLKKAISVKWEKITSKVAVSRITGYQVQVANNKSFTSGKKSYKIKGYLNTSKKISGLKSNKTYYVRVRTYFASNGDNFYSDWSKVKKVKTKKATTTKTKKSKTSAGTVYWVPNGKVYHLSRYCSSLSRSRVIYSGSVSESRKPRACKVCG